MKAAVINVLGQAPQYQDFAEPAPIEGEYLINVKAAGLHPIVRAIAKGAHYSDSGEVPMIPGIDGVGIRPDGQRVYFGGARKPWGTMAERCAVPAAMTIPLPDSIEDAQAAAIANPGMSAWLSLKERGQLAAGETVLIMGATGVAGHLAIQFARLLGAKKIIAAGRNVEALAGEDVDAVLGLTEPEDAVREALTAQALEGIDVVIDYLWGRPTELVLDALAKGFKPSATRTTRLVEVGESAGRTITLPGATLRSIDLRILGSGFGAVRLDTIFQTIPHLFAMAAEGKVRIDAEPVPLTEVETAWERRESARRIVFTL
ncbi:MAG TPA: zinc-binding alcohol dehydrogenase family protein [Terracidiphilus sp.]|nr:zinc-binding alcohol dehydrogenase family protein [Terracidiphilus sp.]